jgi:hypothetical protein
MFIYCHGNMLGYTLCVFFCHCLTFTFNGVKVISSKYVASNLHNRKTHTKTIVARYPCADVKILICNQYNCPRISRLRTKRRTGIELIICNAMPKLKLYLLFTSAEGPYFTHPRRGCFCHMINYVILRCCWPLHVTMCTRSHEDYITPKRDSSNGLYSCRLRLRKH